MVCLLGGHRKTVVFLFSNRLYQRVGTIAPRSQTLSTTRPSSTNASHTHFDAVVIGAGPGGLTATSNLLDQGLSSICMIDPHFTAGRINERYREVPSNTKAGMFSQWATGTKAFSDILDSAPAPNAYTKLLSFDQDKGCILGDAIDVAQLLSDGLRKDARVTSVKARVSFLAKGNSVWQLPQQEKMSTDRVVLAHGAHPKMNQLRPHSHGTTIDLDTCLKPSALKNAVPSGSKVAVIGASHSAVLAMKNLYELEGVKIVNFYRSPLLYAEYKDGWILHDNTGLKGVAADWAREVLEKADGDFRDQKLRRVCLRPSGGKTDSFANKSLSRNADAVDELQRYEKEVYKRELTKCTHVVSAVGYKMNPMPEVVVDGKTMSPMFDPLTGAFKDEEDRKLTGLFGTGIAFPERVVDPLGNVESAVGWFKFMKFVKRVAPDWANSKV